MSKKQPPEKLWEDEKGYCKIMFYPDNGKLFLEVGGVLQILYLKIALGSSFIRFLNEWHESRSQVSHPDNHKEIKEREV